MRYTKGDVEFHRDWYGPNRPAINVKVGLLNWPLHTLGVPDELAEEAGNIAFIRAQEAFWNWIVPDWAQQCLGDVDVFAEGRSGGWLVVEGLEDFETWDAIQLAKWHKFEVGIRDIIREITSWDRIQEDIEEIIHEIRSRPRYASGVLS